MFKNQIRLYGKHAEYLKRYSRDKQAEEKYEFNVTALNGVTTPIYIFDTMIECYMVAAMIGIIEKRKSSEDKNKSIYANIMADTVYGRVDILKRISHFMILVDDSLDLSVDGKIKKAFSIDKEDDEQLEEEMNAYVRGGLEIINEAFKDAETLEDVVNQIAIFFDKYKI